MLPAGAVLPMRTRRRIYAAALGAGILLGLAWGVGSLYARSTSGQPLPSAAFPTLACVIAATLGLLWLRPRPLVYALGLVCLLLALAGPWVAASGLLRHWPASGYQLGWLSLLFPVAWILLAGSIGAWRLGLLSYLLVGLTFILMIVVGGLIGPAPPWGRSIFTPWDLLPSRYHLPFMWLLWPQYALGFLNVSQWGPPVGE
jgi:hypothetical protein